MLACCCVTEGPIKETDGLVKEETDGVITDDKHLKGVIAQSPTLAEVIIQEQEPAGPAPKEPAGPASKEEPGKETPKEPAPQAEPKEAAPQEEPKEAGPRQAATEEVVPEVPDVGIRLEFHQGSVVFTRRPVQITFDYLKSPAEVCMVAGHGAELGIQLGWTVKSMDGAEVDSDFQVFYSKFLARMNSLEGPYELPLLFKKTGGDGSYKTVQIPSTPIDMTLAKTIPATVSEARGLALQVGIQKGWTLVKYADKPVDAHPNFDAFWADFTSNLAKIPKRS